MLAQLLERLKQKDHNFKASPADNFAESKTEDEEEPLKTDGVALSSEATTLSGHFLLLPL